MQKRQEGPDHEEQPSGDWREATRAIAFRVTCGFAAILVVYLVSVCLKARHPGWLAASLGLLLAVPAALAAGDPPPGFFSLSRHPRPTVRTRSTLVMSAAAFLFLMALLPVITAELPPLHDYPNHLARIYVIAFGGQDPLLTKFYEIKWQLIPDLAMDIIVPPIAKLTGTYLAGKLFIIIYMLLLLTGPQAIYVALHRSLSLGPLAAALFIYNATTKFGLVSYNFGVGLALWGIAVWIATRRASPIARAVLATLWILVLFFSHISALVVYGVAVASFEAWLEWSRQLPPQRRLVDFGILILPFAAIAPLLLLGPTNSAPPMPMHWGGLFARGEGIRFIVQAYAWPYDLSAGVVIVLVAVWALRRRILTVHPWSWVFLPFAIAAFLALPNEAMGGWGASERLPVAFVFVLLGMLQWDLVTARSRWMFLGGLSAIALFRFATVEAVWLQFDRIRADFVSSLKFIEPGSRVLVARDWTNAINSLSTIANLPCLAIVERSSLVSLEYSHPLQQILVVKPPYRAVTGGYDDDPIPLPLLLSPPSQQATGPLFFDPSGRIYWADWSRNYDYLYVLDRQDAPNPAPNHLDLLRNGSHYQLFRVRGSSAAAPATPH